MRSARLAALAFVALAIPAACSSAGSSPSVPVSTSGGSASAAPTSSAMSTHDAMSASPTATDAMMSAAPSAMSSGSPDASGMMSAGPSASGDAMATDSKAADLRVTVDRLLGEHIVLASKATAAALGGRTDEFSAYGDLLNTNGTDIGALIGAAYGNDAKDQFNKIWSAHNGFFVDYTTGVAKGDKAMQDKAVSDLTTVYVPQFADFIASATGLPKDAVTTLTTEHVVTTKAVVDAQGSKNAADAAAKDRTAAQHMQMIGDPLAKAIVAKLPAKFQ